MEKGEGAKVCVGGLSQLNGVMGGVSLRKWSLKRKADSREPCGRRGNREYR